MQVFLICEKKESKLINKLIKKISIEENIIILNFEIEKLNLKTKVKIANKIKNIVKNSNEIIISKNIKNDKQFVDLLYGLNFQIIDGRNLFLNLANKYIEYICGYYNRKEEETSISITVNNVKYTKLVNIEEMAKKYKTINIVTNNIEYFEKLKSKLWNEFGIILIITNNRKKALLKSDIILNVDFPQEMINKYLIKDNAILINFKTKVKINKKRFCGKIINDYEIKLKNNSNIKEILEQEKYKDFDLKDLTEVYVLNYRSEIENVIIIK